MKKDIKIVFISEGEEEMLLLLINIYIGALAFIISKFTPSEKDIFQCMKEINELLEEFDERTREVIIYTLNFILENRARGYLIIFLLYCIPILNLFLLINAIKKYRDYYKVK